MGVCAVCGDPSQIGVNGKPMCLPCMAANTCPGPKPNPGTAQYEARRKGFKKEFDRLEAEQQQAKAKRAREQALAETVQNKQAEKKPKPERSFGEAAAHLFGVTAAYFRDKDCDIAKAWALWDDKSVPEEAFIAQCEKL